ncbi:MAG: OsmC family peroxiredoxin [Rhodospirillaceae bacterium]|nr:OsmC family peroxiredoxin [Rhodospirillaceae bacterium]
MKEGVQYPCYIGISDVSTTSFEQMRVEAFFEGQPSIMFDEPAGFDIGDPPELQGRSRGWTPVHAQLAALAGCTSITCTVVARDMKFKYKSMRTKIRSLIDIRGFFFDLHLQPQYQQINFDLFFDTKESAARMKAFANEVDRRCPQIGLFHKAKMPLVMSWYRGNEPKPLHEDCFDLPKGPTPEEKLIAQAKAEAKKKSKKK